jgi:hypothetical protein
MDKVMKMTPTERIKDLKWHYKIIIPLGFVAAFMVLYHIYFSTLETLAK